jgi:dissimilatory sulfite reductase (desulfoviridin) alpha/beta subunit
MMIAGKQKGLGINQVLITTKQAECKYCTDAQLLAVTLKIDEEAPYKPDTFHLRLKLSTCPHFCPQTTAN